MTETEGTVAEAAPDTGEQGEVEVVIDSTFSQGTRDVRSRADRTAAPAAPKADDTPPGKPASKAEAAADEGSEAAVALIGQQTYDKVKDNQIGRAHV